MTPVVGIDTMAREHGLARRHSRKAKPMTTLEVRQYKSRHIHLPKPLKPLFGKLGFTFVAMFYGTPGGGKSCCLMRTCQHLASETRPILFWSYEEGTTSDSFMDKIQMLEICNDYIVWSGADSITEIEKVLLEGYPDNSKPYWLLCVDSLDAAPLNIDGLLDLCNLYNLNVIFVSHSTKDGGYRGETSRLHLVDVAIQFNDPERHTFQTVKNRFSGNVRPIGCARDI